MTLLALSLPACSGVTGASATEPGLAVPSDPDSSPAEPRLAFSIDGMKSVNGAL
jgi:hypothetical protein